MIQFRKVLMLPAIALFALAFANSNIAVAQSTTHEDLKAEILRLQLIKLKADVAKATADAAKAEADADKAKSQAEDAKAARPLTPAAETSRRLRIGEIAVAQMDNHGQEIVTGAFPYAIGKVPYRHRKLIGVASAKDGKDGYDATVNLYYTNIVNSDFYMQIHINYDSMGGFRSMRIGHCTDKYWDPHWNAETLAKLVKLLN